MVPLRAGNRLIISAAAYAKLRFDENLPKPNDNTHCEAVALIESRLLHNKKTLPNRFPGLILLSMVEYFI